MAAYLLKDMVGKTYDNSFGTSFTIVEYINSKNITVQFQDDNMHVTKTRLQSIKKGNVRNPFDKSVFGVGYIGIGVHSPTDGKKATIAYEHWRSMLLRCYCRNTQQTNPTYIGCTVSEDWHCFNTFAEWFYKNKFHTYGYQLDKDILVKGNKNYSAETCSLVPREINTLFNSREAARGIFSQGVRPYNNSGRFEAKVRQSGVYRPLGVFDTPEEASEAYKAGKEARVKEVALKWKGKIEDKAFQALMVWELN
jgi:hypothetical protein